MWCAVLLLISRDFAKLEPLPSQWTGLEIRVNLGRCVYQSVANYRWTQGTARGEVSACVQTTNKNNYHLLSPSFNMLTLNCWINSCNVLIDETEREDLLHLLFQRGHYVWLFPDIFVLPACLSMTWEHKYISCTVACFQNYCRSSHILYPQT